jgi:hydroxymethylpyrimidine/phosphomethylpyrimidine kinase
MLINEYKEKSMRTALTIAGSDSCGGAGIQADLKTMTMNGVYAMTAITALTAQNTTGVRDILEATPYFLQEQIDAVFEDIRPDAVKIGMVSSSELIRVIGDRLRHYQATNIVVDPVMVATSGSALMKTDALETLIEELFPLATVVTPNIPEGEVLSGLSIRSKEEMEEAARKIGSDYSCAVLLKGGHSLCDATDLLYADGRFTWFPGNRIDNPNTHGTGCTLSSAIAANLAKGFSLKASVQRAKNYISGALAAGLDLGRGAGPLMHNFALQGEFTEEEGIDHE